MSNTAFEGLQNALEAHGVACVAHGDCLEADAGNLWVRADVYVHEEKPQHTRVVLEVTAVSHRIGEKAIREAFAGLGADVERATQEAFGKFLLGSFHVLIEALTSHECETAQAEIEQWGSVTASWDVYSGPLLSQYSTESLLVADYSEWLNQLRTLFAQEATAGVHWIRVFLGVMDSQILGAEVLLDNEPWESGERSLRAFPWRGSQEYQSIRHFLVALPPVAKPFELAEVESLGAPRQPWWRFW